MRLSELDIKRSKGNVKTKCPECVSNRSNKTDKSLSVNVESGLYKCHYCGVHGMLDEFKPSKPIEVEEYSQPKLNTTGLGDDILNYFVGRSISVTTLNENYVTQSPKGWIEFNYFEFDQLVNVKYRSIAEKRFMQHKGGKPILYGLNDITGEDEIIICEGEIDKLSLWEAGYKNACSVPMGAPNPTDSNADGKLKCFEFASQYIKPDARIIIAVDTDKNGQRLKDEIARRFGKERCSVVSWGQYKDANEALMSEGVDFVKRCILQAKDYPIEGIVYISDSIDDIRQLYLNGVPEAHSVGMGPTFDQYYKVKEGYLTIVTGIPTHGKSNFVENMMVNLMRSQSWAFGVYSPEHYPVEMFYQRLARIYTGKNFFEGHSNRMSMEELAGSVKFMHDKVYPAYANQSASIDDILEVFAQLVFKYGIKGCLIDPWTDVEHRSGNKSETVYISECLAKIKRFNQKYDVHTWLIVHPTKMRKMDDGSKYHVPTLYDCSGSANFYNRADFGMTIYRQPDDTTTVHIQKVKFEGIYGKKGECDFKYDAAGCSYAPLFINSQTVEVF